jgi:hypothetical protein
MIEEIFEPFIQSELYLMPSRYYNITIKFNGNEKTFTYHNIQFIEFNKKDKFLEFNCTEEQKYGLYNVLYLYPYEIIKAEELID